MDDTQYRVAMAAVKLSMQLPDDDDEAFSAGVLSGLLVALGVSDESFPQATVRASYDHGRDMLLDLAVQLTGGSAIAAEVAGYLEGLQP